MLFAPNIWTAGLTWTSSRRRLQVLSWLQWIRIACCCGCGGSSFFSQRWSFDSVMCCKVFSLHCPGSNPADPDHRWNQLRRHAWLPSLSSTHALQLWRILLWDVQQSQKTMPSASTMTRSMMKCYNMWRTDSQTDCFYCCTLYDLNHEFNLIG